MKKIILTMLMLLCISCGTVDCTKCPVVVKTKVVTPTIACYRPEPYEEFQKTLLSTSGVNSEGKLLEVIVTNILLMERHIKLWEGYRKCVDDIIKIYSNDINTLENNSKKDSK